MCSSDLLMAKRSQPLVAVVQRQRQPLVAKRSQPLVAVVQRQRQPLVAQCQLLVAAQHRRQQPILVVAFLFASLSGMKIGVWKN